MHLCLKMAKKSVDEQSTAEYRFFYQLDWPPERVPPLIELVYFFTIQLACIARKSLEICERCRLSQQNSPATPAFWREEFKTLCFDFTIFKTCSSTDAQRLFKSFLTRNELVDSRKRVIFAG